MSKRGNDGLNKRDNEDSNKRQRRTPEDTTQITMHRSQMEPDDQVDFAPYRRNQAQDSGQEIRDQLTELGAQISLIGERERNPDAEQHFLAMRDDLLQAFENAFDSAQQGVLQREQQRQAEESKGMGEEHTNVTMSIRHNFEQDLSRLTGLMSSSASNMTPGEQVRIYNIILEALRDRLDSSENLRQIENEPNQLDRLSQLITAIYNGSLEILSTTLTTMYNSRAQATRQTVAVVTSGLMVYNWQPEGLRQAYEGIPYFGLLFSVMNRSNRILRILTNSAGTLTTVYYLLRNAEFDRFTDDIIAGTRQMASNIASNCIRNGSLLACRAAEALTASANNLLNIAGNRLGELINENYQNIQIIVPESSGSVSSSSSSSRESLMAVQDLLETPIEQGGISINQNEAVIPQEIINERFNALASDSDNPIIQGQEEEVEEGYMDLPPVSSQDSSGSSGSSDSSLTPNSQASTVNWKYNSSPSGGKRIRKSRRSKPLIKTRKGRKNKRGKKRVTIRKGKKNYRTMKRYRKQMRK
jgi:hypothetical protein